MSDNLGVIWDKFFSHRTRTLWERFPGYYRAIVVETNDPLNMNRVKFLCPDMHDTTIEVEDCPWAVSCMDLGGTRAARFVAPVIGDWIWITFEKQHPFGPIWTGFADPTRRKLYAYPQVFQVSPVSVDPIGKPESAPTDYDKKYLPKDGRPMGHGWVDTYGNMDLHSAVGYFPSAHALAPPPPDHDAVAASEFKQSKKAPEVNDPDKKYMARVTKYGHIFIMGDQGYHWIKESIPTGEPAPTDEDGNVTGPPPSDPYGEFTGDAISDEKFETQRWLFLQRMLNDNVNKASKKNGDQRKQLMLTRYGHKFELRDVGWAQTGPLPSKSRRGEFGPPAILSKEATNDYRWIKIRTKGGMLFQAYDKGFNPQSDTFIKRTNLEDAGPKSEKEDKYWGGEKDARWIRLVTRHGFKLVLDDRGSHKTKARKKELTRGIGFLLKGRRTPAAKKKKMKGNPRGFQFEFNERDDANHATLSSPLGQAIEMNDRYQYMMLTAALGKKWLPKWQHIKRNEFLYQPTMLKDPEKKSHHLKLDHDNEYIRLKTRANKGQKPFKPANKSGVGKKELNQGMEARDGKKGDGPWVELVDCQRRGLWFSKKYQIGIWRAKKKKKIYQWFDEKQKVITIYNNEKNGKIEIYAKKEVNVISAKDVNVSAAKDIKFKAGKRILFQAAGTKFSILPGNVIRTTATIRARRVVAKIASEPVKGWDSNSAAPGGSAVKKVKTPKVPKKKEPRDRAKTYNKPFKKAKEVT